MNSRLKTDGGFGAHDVRRLGRSLSEYVQKLPERERHIVCQMLLQTMEPLDRFLCLEPSEILDRDELTILKPLKEMLTRARKPKSTDISLIVKVTRLCGLKCKYCNDRRSGPGATMSFSVMAQMIARAIEEHKHVRFIWHGGEPTLLPISFYEKVLLVQAQLRGPEQNIANSFQTNATALTEEWARFFRENDIQVGVSIDGPASLHNAHRIYESGKGSYEEVIEGLRLLKQYEVKLSGLVVVDEDTLKFGARRILEFLVEQGIRNFGVLPAKPCNEPDADSGTATSHYIEPARAKAFLAELYDAWLQHGDPGIKIRELDALKAQIRGVSAHTCTLSGDCWGHYFSVESDGSVAACDVFSGDSRYTLGNVMSDSFSEMVNSDRLHQLKKQHLDALEEMRGCSEFHVCRGWCPHERYVSLRHNKLHSDGCCGLKDLITHVRTKMALEPAMSSLSQPSLQETSSGASNRADRRVLLGPKIDLHTGVHNAFTKLLPHHFSHSRTDPVHTFIMTDEEHNSPSRFFHLGEFLDFGPGGGIIHTARWPVLNRKAWVTDTDDFVYPVVSGRHFLSPDFRKAFRGQWSRTFEDNISRRVANMLTAYAHPSCRAVLYRSESTARHARLWLDKLSMGRLAEVYMSKIQVLYPVRESCPRDVVEAKWRKSGPLGVVFCGRDYETKNGRIALDIFDRLSCEFPQHRFCYIGKIPQDELHRRNAQPTHVVHHQSLTHEQTLSVLNESHILLHPSEFEGLGIIFLEAAAYGMAVITATGGAMQDVEELFGTGGAMLVNRDSVKPADEVAAFETHLRCMLGNLEIARSMGDHNFNLATVGRLSPQRNRRTLLKVYEDAMENPADAPLTLEELPYSNGAILRLDSHEVECDGLDYRGELNITQDRFLL